jgi:hypothetical protein
MAVPIEFLRLLRDETGAGACFVQHTGHNGDHMRGTSDFESVYETKLLWKRDGQSALVTIESDHREAEAGEPIRYRISWDHDTRTMRFPLVESESGPTLAARILEHLAEHGSSTTDEVRKGVGVRKSDVLRTLETLEQAGNTHRGRSGRLDQLGRPIQDKAWNLTNQADSPLFVAVPANGNKQEHAASGHRGSVGGPPYVVGDPREQPPDEPNNDDDDSPSWTEWEQALLRLQERDGVRMYGFDEVHAELERMRDEMVDADPGNDEHPPLDDDDADEMHRSLLDHECTVSPIEDLAEDAA